MLLGRLNVRGKLALLVFIPLLATSLLTVATGVLLGQRVSRATTTAAVVRSAALTEALVRALQSERLQSVGYLRGLVDKGQIEQEQATASDRLTELLAGGILTDANRVTMKTAAASLAKLRGLVLAKAMPPTQLLAALNPVLIGIIDVARLLDAVDQNTSQGRQVIALDAAMRISECFDAMYAAMAAVDKPAQLAPFVASLAGASQFVPRLSAYATPDELVLFRSSVAAVDARLGANATVAMAITPNAVLQFPALPSFAALQSLTGFGRYLESKIISDVITAADQSTQLALTQLYGFAAGALIVIVIVLLLGRTVAASVTRPLSRLTASADLVARLAAAELTRVADDDSMAVEPIRLRAVDVDGRDEIAELARAFERVQQTAAGLVERQVAGRRNVALMFGHVGRRTQNLVGRQIALIDRIAGQESEPERRRDIERLDQVASRLRRNASSLVVLSGAGGADERTAPMPLRELVELSRAELEDAGRIDVDVSGPVQVAPALINDLMLLLGELMDNAVSFSPPTTPVVVSARNSGPGELLFPGEAGSSRGVQLELVDHGLGLTPERLAEENTRLAARERLDLAPTEVLGLFVVGRLARRHGLKVHLAATPGGGITATIDLPGNLLTTLRPYVPPGDHEPAAAAVPGLAAIAAEPSGPPAEWPPRPVGRRRAVPAIAAGPTGDVDDDTAVPAVILADPDPELFDVAALDRASRSISTARHWNGFAATEEFEPELDGITGSDQGPGELAPAAPVAASARPVTGTAELNWGESPTVAVPAVLDEVGPDALDRWGEAARRAASMPAPIPVREPAGWGEGTPEPGWSTAIGSSPRRPDPTGPAPAHPVRVDALRADPARSPAIVPRPRPAMRGESVPRPLILPGLPGAAGGPNLGGSGPSGSGPSLNRRVPGATLSALEASNPGPRLPVQLNSRPEDAEQVREKLAQFESGVARAQREVDRPDEG